MFFKKSLKMKSYGKKYSSTYVSCVSSKFCITHMEPSSPYMWDCNHIWEVSKVILVFNNHIKFDFFQLLGRLLSVPIWNKTIIFEIERKIKIIMNPQPFLSPLEALNRVANHYIQLLHLIWQDSPWHFWNSHVHNKLQNKEWHLYPYWSLIFQVWCGKGSPTRIHATYSVIFSNSSTSVSSKRFVILYQAKGDFY